MRKKQLWILTVFLCACITCTVIAGIIAVNLYGNRASNGSEIIAETQFINEEIPIDGSQNFAVDSKNRIYFSTGNILQIYDNNKYIYSLKIPTTNTSFWVTISEDDTINIYPFRSDIVLRYNQKGEQIEEVGADAFTKYDYNHSVYKGNGSVYKSSGGGGYTYDKITQTKDGAVTVIFSIPQWQLQYRHACIIFGVGIVMCILLTVLYLRGKKVCSRAVLTLTNINK